jgi:protein-S-isoprenylcysteine O-methyltransferase Ste14
MSRAERRAYERLTKGQDPRAIPMNAAQKARAERIAQRRATARPAAPEARSRAYWIRATVLAVIAGLLAFSVQWPNMPLAAYVGIGVVIVVLVAAYVLRSVFGRAAASARRGVESRR